MATTSTPAATSSGARAKSPTVASGSQGARSLSKLPPKPSAAVAAVPNKNDVLDSGSDSDSDDHYGFVKVDRWNLPPEPTLPAFKPTISQPAMNVLPSSSSPSFASTARNSNIMARVRSTIRAAVTPATPVAVAQPPNASESAAAIQPTDASSSSSSSSSSDSDDDDDDSNDRAANTAASLSDEEISDVLDETELQLIEAMEDTQIADAKGISGKCTLPKMAPLRPSSPGKGLSWMGPGDISQNNRVTYADSLKERFAAPLKPSGVTVSVSLGFSDSDSSGSDSGDSDREQRPANSALIAAPAAAHIHQPLPKITAPSPLPPAQGPSLFPPAPARAQTGTTISEAVSINGTNARSDLFEARSGDSGADLVRPASVPLDSVEFVAPGVTKKTAMSLLCRVLDIDGPIIQQKMVEFLLIDGVIASLIGFITHCQGSIYSPSPTSQTAPCSPSLSHEAGASCSPDAGCSKLPTTTATTTAAAASAAQASHESASSRHVQPGHDSAAATNAANDKKDLPLGVLHEFEVRRQHRARLQRQRNRSAGLTEVDLRRGYNAVQMLATREQFSRRVMEAKLAVIVPCLMAVFHKDSLGSFHHACLLLEHCFTISPLRTTRLLLYQQNPPSRWWALSDAVAKGHAPICDILPYLSEPCVQRFFLKAEFGVWTGRLMTSLNLMPNDALVVSDELSRMGLGSVAGALGGGAASDDSPAGQTQSQQRAKSLQLVRNRFQQLNRGGFFGHILELIEDSDSYVSEGVAEFMAFMINDCSTFYGFNILFKPIYDSELPVRRLAQLIVNSPAQRLSPQAKAATRLLHSLLTKTACQYGLRTREAQGIRDPEMHPRGSQVLLQ
ncbi:hypothetical protein GGI06_002515, partial [Coemansia sp. S85]